MRFAGSIISSILFKEGTDVKAKPALFKRAGKALQKAAPTILTCVGTAGVVATAVLAVRATPKGAQVHWSGKKRPKTWKTAEI